MSFRLKTVLGIALIEVCLLAGLVVSGLYYLKSSGEKELMTRGRVTAQLVATMTADAVVSLDLATLDDLVAHALQNNGVVYVRVRGRDGTVFSAGGDEKALSLPFAEDHTVESAMPHGRLDVSAPIVAAGQTFGNVEIGLSTSHLEGAIANAQQWMLTIAGTEIILVAVFGLLLGTILTRQLKHLQAGAHRVADGEFGFQLDVRGKDELADTASSFNQMSTALAKFAEDAETARREAEAGQAHAETVLRDALNSMPEGVLIVSPGSDVTFLNESYRKRYPLSEHQDDGQQHFEDVAMLSMADAVELGEEGRLFSIEERIQRLENAEDFPQWRSVLANGNVMLTTQRRMSDGGVVVVEHDVTDLYRVLERNRQLELELMQTHKMEALGTLAGGIAHEINTPLQFIGDNLRFISESFEDVRAFIDQITASKETSFKPLKKKLTDIDWTYIEEETPAALQEAKTGLGAVSRIVRSVKEFAHPERSEKSYQDLGALIENVLTVSRNQWSHHTDVSVSIDSDVKMVPCYPGQLSQVLINLIINAAQAIEEQKRDDKGTISIQAKTADGKVTIAVSDDGPGLPTGKENMIFEMFFTTKPPGQGTGQGLAICKQIIENTHGGKLSAANRPEGGAVFTIELPA